ncbi:hypothetical protein DH2020_041389 [Rehmannia glutinosa]|uniref:Retrovirus-related Pol polyprotein from transposon TNT 1-94-like beta-barrel domain-containing protein n=1 Tax=Rehmannia glutinosa TaxID=99300 RepID=A0ABR0URS0_REHGL
MAKGSPSAKKKTKPRSNANVVEERESTDVDMSAMVSNLVDNPKEWFVDIGATCHVRYDKDAFSSYIPSTGRKLHMGNHASYDVDGVGTVVLKLTLGKELKLKDVFACPRTSAKIWFRVRSLVNHGFRLVFESESFVLANLDEFLGRGYLDKELFKMNVIFVAVLEYE